MTEQDNYDPPVAERKWFRHQMTGDAGYLVRRDGKVHIRYDRPGIDQTILFKEAQWIEETNDAPLTAYQVGQICYAADKQLSYFLGLHDKARKDWLSMRDEDRIAFVQNGPVNPVIRQEVYRAIKAALMVHTKE